jgi:hypothetical protein
MEREENEEIARQTKQFHERGLNCEQTALTQLYAPSVPHEPVPTSEDFGDEYSFKVHRLRVQGVIVRYVEEWDHIMLTAEGDLPSAVVDSLADDLRAALEQIQNVPCEVKAIPS